MSELETVRGLAAAALASLEANRRRIDDLNVYPVPDGDTGTNLTLTARGVVEALERSTAADRPAIAHELTRAALMSARGNSGVILSQIVRGAAEALAEASPVDAPLVARALRGASDAAYRAVRTPVEGTMLTVVRSLAEAAEHEAHPELALEELLPELVARGEETLARTPDMLPVLKEAGVVDAGGAGLLEIVRGIAAAVRGEPIPEPPPEEELSVDAIHQELSRYRYCTVFVVEGAQLDVAGLEDELERLGDSLLVVGDASAVKVHVHTDDPGAALSLGVRAGTIDRIEIANMHAQTAAREERLTEHAPPEEEKATEVVAVVAGDGNRRLFASLGAGRIIEGGQTMNPSTQDILAAIESAPAREAIVLPNNSNVIMSAEQAARLATKPVRVIHTESIPAGLAALVVYDAHRSAEANVAEMHEALEALATGAVTVASRDAEIDGVAVREGEYLGLVEDEAVAAGARFDEVARAVLGRMLAEPKDVLTLLTGDRAPALNGLRAWIEEEHPGLEVEVQDGGQPHYPLLIAAE
ncbi:MAG TPA: DAK2 domain-containing protein [Gaiellaceae bacterium]|nr:DAK2 domain-containing protein [Gaiellaceae bacterium]